jgi:hypothetical protein
MAKTEKDILFVNLNIPRDAEFTPQGRLGEVRVRARTVSAPIGSVFQSRPLTMFDVNNIDHRKHYSDFVKNNRWNETAPRFFIEHPYISVPAMVNAKMLNYYMSLDKAI